MVASWLTVPREPTYGNGLLTFSGTQHFLKTRPTLAKVWQQPQVLAVLFIKFTFRRKQKYKLSGGQIFPGLAGLRGCQTASVSKTTYALKFSASQQPNFSQRQTPDKCAFNLPRLLSLLAPSSVAMKAVLQQQCGVANSRGVCFAHDLHQYFMISFIMTALNILWQRLTGSVLLQVT